MASSAPVAPWVSSRSPRRTSVSLLDTTSEEATFDIPLATPIANDVARNIPAIPIPDIATIALQTINVAIVNDVAETTRCLW
jgi:hypothetical protein